MENKKNLRLWSQVFPAFVFYYRGCLWKHPRVGWTPLLVTLSTFPSILVVSLIIIQSPLTNRFQNYEWEVVQCAWRLLLAFVVTKLIAFVGNCKCFSYRIWFFVKNNKFCGIITCFWRFGLRAIARFAVRHPRGINNCSTARGELSRSDWGEGDASRDRPLAAKLADNKTCQASFVIELSSFRCCVSLLTRLLQFL